MKKGYIFIVTILFFVALVLEGVNIFLANRVDSKSIYASQLQQEASTLDQENLVLKAQVLQYTSFEAIASRAAQLGFSEEKQFVTIYSSSQVAMAK